MKKICILVLAVLLLLLSACGTGNDTLAPDTPAQGETASPTLPPDFSETDFSGRWYVSAVIDSNGEPVGDAKKQELGAGFTLELLQNGAYYVYDESGKALGQGAFTVEGNQLALAAESAQTVYEIADDDTLRIVQPDASITVMTRVTGECADDDAVIPEDSTGDAGNGGEQGGTGPQSPPPAE